MQRDRLYRQSKHSVSRVNQSNRWCLDQVGDGATTESIRLNYALCDPRSRPNIPSLSVGDVQIDVGRYVLRRPLVSGQLTIIPSPGLNSRKMNSDHQIESTAIEMIADMHLGPPDRLRGHLNVMQNDQMNCLRSQTAPTSYGQGRSRWRGASVTNGRDLAKITS
jgi:hypothetical protein